MEVLNLRTDYKINPIGIEAGKILLSWEIHTIEQNIFQTAYQIQAANTLKELVAERNLIWDSGKITSDQSIQIEYKGPDLKSSQKVYWRVKVWNNKGKKGFSKDTNFFETGLITPEDWKAKWISPAINENTSHSTPCPFLRKEFSLKNNISEARLYISAIGLYEARINGKKTGDELFTPGWTSYNKRIQYQVYDISKQLREGKNSIGVILGDGWYRGYLVWQGKKNLYGDKTALIMQIKITYKDGTEDWILSDQTWKSCTGPILKSDIYNGETYDAQKELKTWDLPNYNDDNWSSVNVINHSKDILIPSEGSPVKITKTIKPVKKIITPKGEIVFDLGQNIVGWARFILKGKKGSKITLHHAEVLDNEGNFYIDNLRAAKAEDVYIFKGEGMESYEPHFTFHGFRYIRVSDYTEDIGINDLEGCVIHSNMEMIGEFECSDPLINQLQKNILWGLRGNFLDVPTDCPQRDERLGWTGDAQAFAPTACFNVNTAPFYKKWLKDLALDQKADGSVPWVVPNVVENGGGTGWSDGFGATGWADAAIIIPWNVYMAYGDRQILADQYDSMKAWVEYMIFHAGEQFIFDYGFHFGDWLSFAEYFSYNYNAPDYGYAGAYTEKDLIATAYFYYSTTLMAKIAGILDKKDDYKKYTEILPKIKTAFCDEFITKTGRLTSGTQTAYILALSFGLIPDNMIEQAAKRLADDVKYFGHLTTGFLGTPLICQALSDNGYPELAYMLLFNKRYPSWLYPVTMGATTIWERWDGIKPDGTFQTDGMNSFNHYAYGAVGNWLYAHVAGIQTDEKDPGYKTIIIKPHFTDKLDYVKAQLNSMYGEIACHWQRKDKKININIKIPANTKAQVILPVTTRNIFNKNGSKFKVTEGITINEIPGSVKIIFGSGEYYFYINL